MNDIRQVVPGPPYPGVYQHYKGALYVVHKVISDSTNGCNSRILVLYESLEYKTLNVRAIVEFLEKVHPDGEASIRHHGLHVTCDLCVPRFKLLNMTGDFT